VPSGGGERIGLAGENTFEQERGPAVRGGSDIKDQRPRVGRAAT